MERERTIALGRLLNRLTDVTSNADLQQPITAIETNSKAVRPGALFVAMRGQRADGHRYVAEALRQGASAVVVEAGVPLHLSVDAPVIEVRDTRRALSLLASEFFADPSVSLRVVGVTGTNGKTTTSRMLATILNEAGMPCGIVGTVGAEFGMEEWTLEHTTPLPPELQGLLATMRDRGARCVAMEVSSHALALGRVDDVHFDAAVFTNLTRDHLDFHPTLDAYAAAKRRLFSLAKRCVINVDDAYGARWATELKDREVLTYALERGADLRPKSLTVDRWISRFTLDGQRFELPLAGRFNVYNAIAAIGAARLMDVRDAVSAGALARLNFIPGRMQHLENDGVDVVVDYAHTPDALAQALQAVRERAGGSVIVVFGCGGERDAGKRPQMGSVAARFADGIYVTNDNPRNEDPAAIARAVAAGIGLHPHVVELDRRRAIETAVAEARSGDVLLIAGKGHERYQVIGNQRLPFDDVAVARDALHARSTRR